MAGRIDTASVLKLIRRNPSLSARELMALEGIGSHVDDPRRYAAFWCALETLEHRGSIRRSEKRERCEVSEGRKVYRWTAVAREVAR